MGDETETSDGGFKGNDIKDDIVFDFQDAVQTVFRTEMLGISTADATQKKYSNNRTDGTLGLAPYGEDRHISFLY